MRCLFIDQFARLKNEVEDGPGVVPRAESIESFIKMFDCIPNRPQFVKRVIVRQLKCLSECGSAGKSKLFVSNRPEISRYGSAMSECLLQREYYLLGSEGVL